MSKCISKIKKNLSNEKYRLLLRMATTAIPCIGSYLNVLYNHFLEGWDRRKLDEKIDANNRKQIELATHAFFCVLRCGKQAKIERILDILSAGVEKSTPNEDDAEDLMNIVVELSENEAVVFAEIYRYFGENKAAFGTKQQITEDAAKKRISQYSDTISFYLNRLTAKGLLEEHTGAIWREEGKVYLPTVMGQKLFDTFGHSDPASKRDNFEQSNIESQMQV